jgi:hypothetical protein
MKYGILSITLLACCALFGQEDPDLAMNCRARERAKAKANSGPVFHQGEDSLEDTCRPTYNYPANVGMKDHFGGFVTASYLYWFAGQEGMDLATTATFVEASGSVIPSQEQSTSVFQNFKYSSGYKVGLGYNFNNYDNWMVRLDFTSLHEKSSQSVLAPQTPTSAPGAIVLITDEVLYFTSWFFQNAATSQAIAAEKLSSSWHLGLDLLDGVASRPYYQGKSLTISPFGGLRAAFIKQSLHISADSILNLLPPSEPVNSHNKSHSWGLGPRGGLEAHWLVGSGFRLQGNMGASLLFTRYTKVTHKEDPITLTYPVSYGFKNYNCLRPMAEMNLGLGWLHYFGKCVALDLSATYDFNYLWGQNMMRNLNDLNIIGTNAAANNLYLHGLTVSAALSF